MSFHGGFLGVVIAMALWARKAKRHLADVYDFIAPLVPLGYAAYRMGNFINAELPGRLADPSLPWAMIWPGVEGPRHPSPLYQMIVDGLLVFVLLWIYSRKSRPRLAVGAMFTFLYGCALLYRVFPRAGLASDGGRSVPITSGQMLSLPMIIGALILLVWAYKNDRRAVSAA
ncbi:prolipoprotein diacylglyceryl transferase [Massilia sp. H-1]|nr:prolipoprotein diacylglyceryl transferase [Massilia sp. H-1]